jgi:hypothetical protein
MPSCMPWAPRKCAHCEVCECESQSIYELQRKPQVLVCRECLERDEGEPTMTTPRQTQQAAAPTRQAEQARLMEEARRSPGVADALRLYERLHAHEPVAQAQPVRRYATGGNG